MTNSRFDWRTDEWRRLALHAAQAVLKQVSNPEYTPKTCADAMRQQAQLVEECGNSPKREGVIGEAVETLDMSTAQESPEP